MGLAASQARYLTLSARKNDLEFAAQTISSRRLQLAYKTAEIARQYSDGMNNKVIKVEVGTDYSNGTYTKQWEHVNFKNLAQHNLYLWGIDGKPLNWGTNDASPYKAGTEYVYKHTTGEGENEKEVTEILTQEQYDKLDSTEQAKCTSRTNEFTLDPEYPESLAGKDVESLLISGQACLLDGDFAKYLMDHFDKETGKFSIGANEFTFNEMKNQYINEKGIKDTRTDIDWRSDITGVMEHKYFTEDDEAVQAKYETETAEIQAQDKMLELEIKNIETQHKAIETELESVQKVIQGNIDKTFKIFS